MNTTPYFLYFIFLCLGASIGALVQRAQNRRHASPPAQPAAPAKETAPEAAPANKLAVEGDVEILRAWRASSGKIWLEMDARRLEVKEDLQPDQRRRLVSTLVDLRPWLENAPVPAAAVPVPDVPLQPVPAAVPALKVVKPAKPELKESKPALVLKSIVEQIDDVLQEKLEQEGPFKGRDLHLLEGTGGMVLVKDGIKKYEGIEAVPEAEIQVFIRQAVSDWEKLPHML